MEKRIKDLEEDIREEKKIIRDQTDYKLQKQQNWRREKPYHQAPAHNHRNQMYHQRSHLTQIPINLIGGLLTDHPTTIHTGGLLIKYLITILNTGSTTLYPPLQ
ncbi:Hypothetical predicted protein [Pelobates cultripes]|uniref:Uncharacterized protein n=1 Tax=Pelobates cultripes TaxID=61616 RepID=A0AAD1S5Y2_PELCU|nr:Hypothetical predicted protein [Pelobates cultripes]